MNRQIQLQRKTNETNIVLDLNLDGTGESEICTGVGFFDHMLTLFAKHSGINLKLKCDGDTFVDGHHTVEDAGILLGEAIDRALADRAGICRYGQAILPMDEALILCAVDVSGRGGLYYDVQPTSPVVGTFDTELCEEFFTALARCSKITLHLRQLAGKNTHHILEGTFKAAARALRQAIAVDPAAGGKVPSTKGVL